MEETIITNILNTIALSVVLIIVVIYVKESRVDYGPWESFKRWVRATYFNRRKDPNCVVILKDKRKKGEDDE